MNGEPNVTVVRGKDDIEEAEVTYYPNTGETKLRVGEDKYEDGNWAIVNLCAANARTLARSLEHFALCSEVRHTVRGSK